MSQEDWTKQLKSEANVVILDVRTNEEVTQGVIPNAVHIDIFKGQGFIDELNKLNKESSYYVYCRSGGRSAQACAVMGQLGFKKTYNLVGGFSEWKGDTAFLDNDN